MYSAYNHDKRAFPVKHILLTRKSGFKWGRSELNSVSDDKSEKEKQFLLMQSILKCQKEIGVQCSKVVLKVWSQTMSITWEPIRNMDSWAPPQTHWTLRMGLGHRGLISPAGDSDAHSSWRTTALNLHPWREASHPCVIWALNGLQVWWSPWPRREETRAYRLITGSPVFTLLFVIYYFPNFVKGKKARNHCLREPRNFSLI